MRRRLLKLLTVLSLLLCVAVVALWVRSYRWSDQLLWWSPDAALAVYYEHGRVYLAAAWPLSQSKRGWERVARDVTGQPGVWERDAGAFNYSVSLLGFGYGNADRVDGIADRLRLVTVPYWFLCLAFAALPASRLSVRCAAAASPAPACASAAATTCGPVPAAARSAARW